MSEALVSWYRGCIERSEVRSRHLAELGAPVDIVVNEQKWRYLCERQLEEAERFVKKLRGEDEI